VPFYLHVTMLTLLQKIERIAGGSNKHELPYGTASNGIGLFSDTLKTLTEATKQSKLWLTASDVYNNLIPFSNNSCTNPVGFTRINFPD